jgi:hypothetical protein
MPGVLSASDHFGIMREGAVFRSMPRRQFLTLAVAAHAFGATPLRIDVWHGLRQKFGNIGLPQRWVNILGSVQPAEIVAQLEYSLNGSPWQPLSKGPDLVRLASPGDFNVEFDREILAPGTNEVRIRAADAQGTRLVQTVVVEYDPGRIWPLPYEVEFSKVTNLQDVCQVVDGRWRRTSDGVRTAVLHYDRVLAFGDMNWTDYSVAAELISHDFPGPGGEGPGFGVNHAGIGLRWRGHADDGKQPRVRWYPLGAATEFTLEKDLSRCRWRILPGPPQRPVYAARAFAIELGRKYWIKGKVKTLANGRSLYSSRIWASGEAEPDEWHVENMEQPSQDFSSGSAPLVAHRSDLTFCRIIIRPAD